MCRERASRQSLSKVPPLAAVLCIQPESWNSMSSQPNSEESRAYRFAIDKNRLQILHRLENLLEMPMVVLGAVWLCLMVVELVWGIGKIGQTMGMAIWIVFIIDFLLRFVIAPRKVRYLKRNWLTAIALVLPALRIFRFARVFRTISRLRGLQLVRILGSINRGMRALGKTMQRRGFGYVLALTFIVTAAGAAGMLSFEKNLPDGQGLNDFWTALWWTAMIMTTMGSEYWPRTPEGRALCLLLAIYAFAVFGYVTGTIATYFIGRDAADEQGDLAGQKKIDALIKEIAALRDEIRTSKDR
jgi:voltage-gated potassium channel